MYILFPIYIYIIIATIICCFTMFCDNAIKQIIGVFLLGGIVFVFALNVLWTEILYRKNIVNKKENIK